MKVEEKELPSRPALLEFGPRSALVGFGPRPLVPVAISLIIGILFFSRFQPGALISAALLYIFLLFLVVSVFSLVLRFRYALLPVSLASFCLGGFLILPLVNPIITSDHIRHWVEENGGKVTAIIEGRVVGTVERRGSLTRFYVEINKVGKDKIETTEASGRVRLNLTGRGATGAGIVRGEQVRTRVRLSIPRNLANPGGFDYEWWLGRKGVLVTGYVVGKRGSPATVERIEGRLGPLAGAARFVSAVRAKVSDRIDAQVVGDGDIAGLLKALVTGERGGVAEETKEIFRRTGTAHLLAISGLHIGIVALLSYTLFFSLLRLSERAMLATNIKKISALLSLLPVVFYAMIAGMSVSTERAVIMVAAYVLVYLTDRGRDLINVLALAAVVVLLISPGSLWDASFQLSFTAVFGIIVILPALTSLIKKDDKWAFASEGHARKIMIRVAGFFFITLAATIATIPLAALYFNRVSLVGLFINIFIVPVVGFVVVPLALISVPLMLVSDTLSTLLLTISGGLLQGVVAFLKAVSAFNYSALWLSTPSVAGVILFYLFVLSLLAFGRGRIYKCAAVVLALLVIVNVVLPLAGNKSGDELTVTFLSIGQGDGAFVEFPGGETMLIDGGPSYRGFDMGRVAVAPFLWGKGIKKIDYIVMSHEQADHMGGLKFIAQNFSPNEFWWNGVGKKKKHKKFREAIENSGAKVLVKDRSSEVIEIGGVEVQFLNPGAAAGKGVGSRVDLNEESLVMRLVYNDRAILFTGDIGVRREAALLKASALGAISLKSDILKAPHHGSKTSSSRDFLAEVSPEYVVASVGYKNRFGFPHPKIVKRYHDEGAKLLRTDRDGAISVVTDGTAIEVRTYLTAQASRSILKVRYFHDQATTLVSSGSHDSTGFFTKRQPL